jgi:chemotaxis family two-component system response regulator Rcp1
LYRLGPDRPQLVEAGENNPMDILLVEDNEGDARLLREVLSGINKTVRLHVVTDGLEAMAFLKYQRPYLDAPRPQLILLDMRMPNLGGLEVLVQIKSDVGLRTIPIVVLTTSNSEADIVQSYQLMASCHLTKPGQLAEFERLIKSLNDFWLTKVTFQRVDRNVMAPEPIG